MSEPNCSYPSLDGEYDIQCHMIDSVEDLLGYEYYFENRTFPAEQIDVAPELINMLIKVLGPQVLQVLSL